MDPAEPTAELRQKIERAKSDYPDPAERDRALAALETDLNDLLGLIRTYRSDARLQQE
jgi:hypothetical protein